MQICSPSAVYLVHLRSSAVSLQDVRASSACREFFAPTQACPSLVRITTLRTHRSANRYLTSLRGKLARMHSSYSPRSSPAIKGVGRGLDPVAQSGRVDTVDQQRPLAKEQPEQLTGENEMRRPVLHSPCELATERAFISVICSSVCAMHIPPYISRRHNGDPGSPRHRRWYVSLN